MELQVDYYSLGEGAMDGLKTIGEYLDRESDLSSALIELVKLRASQINGCAHCAALHAERLEDLGEASDRLRVLPTWQEASGFTERERTALAWTEAVTLIADGIPEDVKQAAHEQFTEQEVVDLTFAIGSINVYNRLAVCFREPAIED